MKLLSAKLVDKEDLVVAAELAIINKENNDESGASEVEHLVALHVNQSNADKMPVTPLGYDEIKALVEENGGEMKVEDVDLDEPVYVRKASTRSFMHNNTANIIVNFRYGF